MQPLNRDSRKADSADFADGSARLPSKRTLIEPRSGWWLLDWRELWNYRELLWVLTVRDITVRYKQTVVGAAWTVIQPVATMVVFSVFFGRLVHLNEETGVIPYPIFVFAGLLPWYLFSGTMLSATTSVLANNAVLTKIYFPRILFPLASAGVNLLNFLVSLLVLAALMIWYQTVPSLSILLIPVLALWTTLVALSFAIGLSALVISFRDFAQIVPFMLQLWLYMTPVIYPPDIIPEEFRGLLAFNPMTGICEAFRYCLIGNVPFPWYGLATGALIAGAVLVVSLLYFRRAESTFADII